MKLIIWIGGRPLTRGYKIREFLWVEEHKCYLYRGRPLEAEEFNEAFVECVKRNHDLNPGVRVLPTPQPQTETVAAPSPTVKVEIAPVPTPTLTTEAAIAYLAEHAPELLKRRGPPPRTPNSAADKVESFG